MRHWLPAERVRALFAMMLLVAHDMLMVLLAILAAGWLQAGHVRGSLLADHLASLPLVLGTFVLCYYLLRLYHSHWQFAGMEMVWSVMAANVMATSLSALWQQQFDGAAMPLSTLVILLLLTTAFIGGQRLLLRMVMERLGRAASLEETRAESPKRAVVLSRGAFVLEVLIALEKEPARRYEIVGLLDEEPRHHGTFLRGVRILGRFDRLYGMLERHEVDEVIIALPNGDAGQLRQLILACCHHKVAVRVLPVISDILGNPAAHAAHARHDVRIEDLLHRAPVEVDDPSVRQFLTGRRVLVTGAGGSIGSELCRQIAHANPALLVLLGHGENSVVATQRELARLFPELAMSLVPVICDVRDEARMRHILSHFTPQVIFHAAAHKHVPLMEDNVCEAVANNVGGMRSLARAATATGVERVVLISTDKAVNPTSVMGATKFLCEELACAAGATSSTSFVTVRFGNVLGSRGSVVPYFQEQILHGGPLTVTHPEMRRYFMTIPEAATLVLHAGAVGESGNLFVLDMGKPVRIMDLAENLIRLSGLEPYRDVDIAFCGLRPGEKLTEELFTETERQQVLTHDRMFTVARPQTLSPTELNEAVEELLQGAWQQDEPLTMHRLAILVPSVSRWQGDAAMVRADEE